MQANIAAGARKEAGEGSIAAQECSVTTNFNKGKMMATKTSKKTRAKIAVKFGGVSIGEDTARLGIVIDRADMPDLLQAESILCGRRLTGDVRVARTNEDTKCLPGMEDVAYCVASTFDVKRIGVSPKHISAGLTFALSEIDVSDLAHFSKKSGWLNVQNVAVLEDEEENEEAEGDE